MGLLHDKGKEQVEWQKYIRGVTGYNNEYTQVKHGPNHAYVGALVARNQYPTLASMLASHYTRMSKSVHDASKK